jgi:tyrosyl-tRNA synthetase
VHQFTDRDALDERLGQGLVAGDIGFDCTADILHVGEAARLLAGDAVQQFLPDAAQVTCPFRRQAMADSRRGNRQASWS